MNEDTLRQLLLDADTGQGPPIDPAALAQSVRRRLQRRRQSRRFAAFVVVSLALAGAWPFWKRPIHAPSSVPLSPRQAAMSPQELADLRNDTDARMAAVDEMLRRQAVVVVPDRPDPMLAVRLALEQSSLISLEYGQRLEQIEGCKEQARAQYRRVMELFPDSRGAELARRRLDQLGEG